VGTRNVLRAAVIAALMTVASLFALVSAGAAKASANVSCSTALQALAQVPAPQRLHDEVDLVRTADLLVDVLEKHNVVDRISEDLLQALDTATAIRTPALRRRSPAG
jgi:predicted patatin/cPLA2 family phospholipase